MTTRSKVLIAFAITVYLLIEAAPFIGVAAYFVITGQPFSFHAVWMLGTGIVDKASTNLTAFWIWLGASETFAPLLGALTALSAGLLLSLLLLKFYKRLSIWKYLPWHP